MKHWTYYRKVQLLQNSHHKICGMRIMTASLILNYLSWDFIDLLIYSFIYLLLPKVWYSLYSIPLWGFFFVCFWFSFLVCFFLINTRDLIVGMLFWFVHNEAQKGDLLYFLTQHETGCSRTPPTNNQMEETITYKSLHVDPGNTFKP